MRILFCCPIAPNPRRGMAKVYVEIASAFERLGWETTIVGADVWAGGWPTRALGLRAFLRDQAAGYDVVEYEHTDLPFPRSEFAPGPLFVARSVLLAQHFLTVQIPTRRGLRRAIGRFLFGRARRRAAEQHAAAATATCREADLVNVPNDDDRAALIDHGIPPDRILVLPYALSPARRHELERVPIDAPHDPVVGFVGTFDPRKGMLDFPTIFSRVCQAVPAARFRLIGTAGMVRSAADVRAEFPREVRERLDVVPAFDPAGLPRLLTGVSVGIFPSAVEGFPFGVLEMLAAAVPVIGYRAPGLPAMLPDDYLVPRGDAVGLGHKVIELLTDREKLSAARAWARGRAADFCWDDIARRTAGAYIQRMTGSRSRAGIEPAR